MKEWSYLQGQQANECGKTLCCHEAHTVAGVAHTPEHRNHQEYDVGDNVHIQLLHDTWEHSSKGRCWECPSYTLNLQLVLQVLQVRNRY